jgi:hypothetical protein
MKKELKYKTNWIGLIRIILTAIVMGFFGLGLPNVIARLNNNNLFYGQYASYVVICLIFYELVYDVKLKKEITGEGE